MQLSYLPFIGGKEVHGPTGVFIPPHVATPSLKLKHFMEVPKATTWSRTGGPSSL